MKKNAVPVEKNTAQYSISRVKVARSALGAVMVFTIINLVLLLIGENRYFLFSAAVPFYLTTLAYAIDDFVIGGVTIGALVISALILGLYLLCFLLSGKQMGKGSGWLIASLVLFTLDTLGLLAATFLLMDSPMDNILDIGFHVLVIVELANGIRHNGKLRELRQEALSSVSRPQVELD